ncbi:probable CDP-diacylglycerol--serine O-phosphatidyltransferase [Saccharomycodes ludwigii]|uniref:CDP-diacylglycerol--serine O-phosphatidyltransferase n=1 Tax=Saccharomycodes ludwigii TaxID=36035 RepID=A0A376B3C3_9ASCO|nr:hypothetical protein SCDLUD_002355 [Saccharomycodes ludwigii]KAH3900896.1 hypothetical protein SCDLUD_002355 [Saccharomycodes ludwigii]SSD59112.1 probable CDP-diacylglycerol--serine O-phosphatidyltransferase [Saccharomycodes ludwigii]
MSTASSSNSNHTLNRDNLKKLKKELQKQKMFDEDYHAIMTDDEDNMIKNNEIGSRTSSRRASSIFSLDTSPLDPPNETDMLKFTSDDHHFSMIRNLHLADYITMMNGFCGFYSIISCLRFTLTNRPHYVHRAHLFILLGVFFDFFDGRVARLRNRSSLMGQELDSLADLISFGVAPASIAFAIGFQSTVDVLCLSFFVLCGLTRLARFNVTVSQIPHDFSGKSRYFEGFPIPTTLFWVAVMEYLVKKGFILNNLPLGILYSNQWYEFHPFVLVFFIHGCLMISKSLKLPKP